MTWRIVVRCDASVEIGSGHVMRCLTLANTLRENGAEVSFVCRDHPGHLFSLIESSNYRLFRLPPATSASSGRLSHAHWLGATQEEDARQTAEAMATLGEIAWLIIDHYALDAEWERILRPYAKCLMVIDDLADRQHHCDILLDQNLQEPNRYAGLVPATCRTLIGPKYSLLRPQFETVRGKLRERTGSVSRLLVFCGGSDVGGTTLKILTAIDAVRRSDLLVDVVVGASNPHRVAIESVCRDNPRVTLHAMVEDMAKHMECADLFIGCGGTSSWERCCLGLPALVISTAENQIYQSEALARAGAQLYVGHAPRVAPERLAQLLDLVLFMPDLLRHLGDEGRTLVDGRGAWRVANFLLAGELRLRRAQSTDSDAVLSWRNHPQTRRYAFDPNPIEHEKHQQWFAAMLCHPNRELLIAERDQQPIGVLRYDISEGHAAVSVYLVPGLVGSGWGTRLLLAGECWLKEMRPDVQACDAEIAANNAPSLAVFRGLGFMPYRFSFRKEIYGNC